MDDKMKKEPLQRIGSSENLFNSTFHKMRYSKQVTSKSIPDDYLDQHGPSFDFDLENQEKKEEN